ncbi:hypothetical protein Tsubulata_019210 [Turnera subulata]|uniref:Cytochrome P450 n=1 Tax=Turnera subulata TaxID=218843 RepID=A0A9Q0G018_9ROSI|nr:hypothetical protein Tsubulata_019210 [Turnera subulata]
MANLWALHRNPNAWEDRDEFRPERFEEAALDGPNCSKFAPFGMGRRSCAGALMGMSMTSLPLGALIQCFDWDRIGIELRRRHGMRHRRNRIEEEEAFAGFVYSMPPFSSSPFPCLEEFYNSNIFICINNGWVKGTFIVLYLCL